MEFMNVTDPIATFNQQQARIVELSHNEPVWVWIVSALGFIFVFYSLLNTWGSDQVKAPRVGVLSKYEPLWVTRFRFFQGATSMINDGYAKFNDSIFKVPGSKADILVLSNKYIDEVRVLPDTILDSLQPLINNIHCGFSGCEILTESDLHKRIIQTKLTPNLGVFIPSVWAELGLAIKKDFPTSEDKWTSVNAYHEILHLVARISAVVFVGAPTCRDEKWLSASTSYSESVFMTSALMRVFPPKLRLGLSTFLPSAWMVPFYRRRSTKIIENLIKERVAAQSTGEASYEKPDDFLQWMMDAADENDAQPHKLAQRQLIMSLASIHTTTMSTVHTIYDLCERPEYVQPLREEIECVLGEDNGWQKTSLEKMRKLDSFMKESQRFNPPSQLSFNRILKEPHTLSDGVHLTKGTHITMASGPTQFDAAVVSHPRQFDGFRAYNRRLDPAENSKHRFTNTDNDCFHFGHGSHACPGRFFASNQIKMILVHFLLAYDFQFPSKKGRPSNYRAHEYIFPDPSGKVDIREREGGSRKWLDGALGASES